MKNGFLARRGATALVTLIIATAVAVPAHGATPVGSNQINTNSRAAVAAAYANQWLPTTKSPINWTGDAASCQAGTQSDDSLIKGVQAVNFYRGLAGLDGISFTETQNAMAQQTALMMEANGQLSHTPDSSWKCYTSQGAQGAATSNLHGGTGNYYIGSASVPIEKYMDDAGPGNGPVGHRRWVLNPDTVTMGMGTTKAYNALNIAGAPTDSSRANPVMIGFPNSGYFPQQLEPNGRWSLSSDHGVDFSAATVNVKDASGTAIQVSPVSTAEGYGPNTISFQIYVSYATGTSESDYTVTVDNMRKDNLPFSYTYTVRLFDGNVSTSSVAPTDPMPTLPTPAISVVPQAPTFGTGTYTIPTTIGVVYTVDGALTQTGTYNASSPIAITAEAASPSYTVVGETSWSHDFTPVAPPQPITITPIAPTFTDTSYTIPYQDGVRYKVNGGLASPGTYTAGSLVSIAAQAQPGYVLSGTTTWSKDFTPVFTQPTPVMPAAPTFGDSSYTIPSTTGVEYLVDNVVKPAGTYSANTNISITANAKPGYTLTGTVLWIKNLTPVSTFSPSIRASGDVVAIDPIGTLYDYGDLTSGRRAIGSGWNGFSNLKVVDWNSDGTMDIVAEDPNGVLYLYEGASWGGFTKIRIGGGWQAYDISVAPWVKGANFPSVIAKNRANGNLYYYANTSGTGVSSPVQIGSGWSSFDICVSDWDKDGNADVIAKNLTGQLLLYRTDGAGRFINETRAVIGAGWNGFSTSTISNFRGAYADGFLARRPDGRLSYYEMIGSGWAKPIQVGSGWGGYTLAGR